MDTVVPGIRTAGRLGSRGRRGYSFRRGSETSPGNFWVLEIQCSGHASSFQKSGFI